MNTTKIKYFIPLLLVVSLGMLIFLNIPKTEPEVSKSILPNPTTNTQSDISQETERYQEDEEATPVKLGYAKPIVWIGQAYSGGIGEPIQFDASGSYDPSGLSLTLYEWDFNADGIFEFQSTEPSATHTYSEAFNDLVVMRATGIGGSAIASARTVVNTLGYAPQGDEEPCELDERGFSIFLDENENIREHLLTAGALGELLCDLLGVVGQEKNDVISALLIHDWDKLAEKKYLKQVAFRHTPSYKDLQAFKTQSAGNLEKMGFSERVIKLSDEVVTHEEGGPKLLPEMIVFYVDAMLISSKIVDIPLRFDFTKEGWHGGKKQYVEELRVRNKEYSEKFFRGAPGHDNRPHFDIQEETGDKIGKKFLRILAEQKTDINDSKYQYIHEDPNKLPYYFEDKLKGIILNV